MEMSQNRSPKSIRPPLERISARAVRVQIVQNGEKIVHTTGFRPLRVSVAQRGLGVILQVPRRRTQMSQIPPPRTICISSVSASLRHCLPRVSRAQRPRLVSRTKTRQRRPVSAGSRLAPWAEVAPSWMHLGKFLSTSLSSTTLSAR